MEELVKILSEIRDGIDYYNQENLIDDGIFGSIEIVQCIVSLEDEYDITISPEYILPENFNSAKKIFDMIEQIKAHK